MKLFAQTRWWWFLVLAGCLGVNRAAAQGTAFTYQGLLNTPAIPANGTYALQFTLYSSLTGGTMLAGPVINSAITFTNGFFSTTVDFGAGAFSGGTNWLDIAVQPLAAGPFLSLPPRQQITPVPYAMYAASAAYVLQASTAAMASNVVAGIAITNAFITNSVFAGDGSGLTSLAYASLVGAPVIPATNGFVTAAITNGLASTDFVLAQGYLTSANAFMTNAFITNSVFAGNGGGLTNLGYASLVGAPVIPSTNGFVTAAITNGLASNGGVITGTFVGNGAGLTNLSVSFNQLPAGVLTNGASGVTLNGTFAGTFVGLSNSISLQALGLGTAVISATNITTGFSLSATVSVGNGPYSLVAVDVNGDGKMDLVSANAGAASLSVLTNSGTGWFGLASSPGVGSQPYCVVSADVNGDGKPDLISANVGTGTLSVLTNSGTGSFGLAATLVAGSQPVSVTTADVNGDGKVDLICANYGSSTLTVYLNHGSGGLALAATVPVGSSPVAVTAAANLFADGRVGLICANAGSATLTVLTNGGGGNFGILASPAVGTDPESVAVADVNGDGKLDLIAANAGDSTLTVLTNNGAMGFGWFALLGTGAAPESVVTADVNQDGKPDLITANSGANTLTVLTNNGSGFGLYALINVGLGPRAVVAADVNGDGKPDLVSANGSAGSLSVVTNNWSANPSVNFTGTFSGNGAGLTGIPVSAIKGGITTNISIGGRVLYISNGIIVNVQ